MKSFEHNRRDGGFTLIELLVVIAIIAILAAILFPVFMTAKDHARTATCSSNLRQIGMGITLYSNDNNGWTPPLWPSGIYVWMTNGAPSTWKDLIKPYMRSLDLYYCPSDIYPFPTSTPWVASNYGMNPAFQVFNNKGAYRPNYQKLYWCQPIPLSVVTKPTRTLLAADIIGYDAQVWYAWDYNVYVPPAVPLVNGIIENGVIYCRHSGGANVAFCDGHVKWESASTIAANFFTWVRANQ